MAGNANLSPVYVFGEGYDWEKTSTDFVCQSSTHKPSLLRGRTQIQQHTGTTHRFGWAHRAEHTALTSCGRPAVLGLLLAARGYLVVLQNCSGQLLPAQEEKQDANTQHLY